MKYWKGFGSRMHAALAIWLTVQLSIVSAASPVIGVVVAKGSFQLDSSRVVGNGTVFDGSTIETQKATSQLSLTGGARMMLDTASKGRIYRDRMELEKGTGQIQHAAGFPIKAANLSVVSDGT